MLGRTASGLFWMARLLERAENTSRLVEAGFRMALTRSQPGEEEWRSVLVTAGCHDTYRARHDMIDGAKVADFALRDRSNPSSVLSTLHAARENARMTRTALTREMWEAINDFWMTLRDALKRPPSETDLPEILTMIRQQGAQVRGATTGTMLRNDIYNFVILGIMCERADNTARILDTKYYVLLPTSASVGSPLDNVQWEMILRSASAQRSFHWLNGGSVTPRSIADFLVFDTRMPRSLAYCYQTITHELDCLFRQYGQRVTAHDLATSLEASLAATNVDSVFDSGLHEFLTDFLGRNAALSTQIERDYRFAE
ncbi:MULTISPECIES: alpha-E domain-containing protein [Hyphomonas]|uniref:alpha-E domain-containing protein n=1 Tax=Hyphomonas TaxID=85 RepID=UPI00351526E6